MSKSKNMSTLNPKVLRWARETAGLSLAEAAQALNCRLSTLAAIEDGQRQPSRPLLLRMAKHYRRSLLSLYLTAPPERGDRGQDFRTLPPGQSVEDEAVLDALIRDLKARQGLVRAIVEEEEAAAPLSFVGSLDMKSGIGTVVQSIRQTLKAELSQYRSQADYDGAFGFLRDRAEAAGIFVLLVGNLGSHHSAIPVELFRGFVIADKYAPFVVINDQDAHPAWTFTLLHELAHLWLGTTGISGGRAEREIEQFCNDVAGEFLLPREEVRDLSVGDSTPQSLAVDLITDFARARLVSRAMVTYKLLRTRKISWDTWRQLDSTFRAVSQQERERFKAQQRKSDGGPSYYVTRRHRVGKALLKLVYRTMDAGNLSPARAALVLGVRPRSVYPLLAPISLIRAPRGLGPT